MSVTYNRRIFPRNIDFKIIRNKRRHIKANLIISPINGTIFNLTLEKPILLSDTTNIMDYFQNLAQKDVDVIEIFCESTRCENSEHNSSRIEISLKDKSKSTIHCSKIQGLHCESKRPLG